MPDREIVEATDYLADSPATHQKKCCGVDLRGLPVLGYEHDGGWKVPGKKKQWLYVVCPKCGYQMSFEHMGIGDRDSVMRKRLYAGRTEA